MALAVRTKRPRDDTSSPVVDLAGEPIPDAGYDEYYRRFLDMSVRVFYGHCSGNNTRPVHASLTHAMSDVKDELDARSGTFDDTDQVEYVLFPERRPLHQRPVVPTSGTVVDVPKQSPVRLGSATFCVNLSSTQLVQKKVYIDGAGLQPDPDWSPPSQKVAFAVQAALSLFNYESAPEWKPGVIDVSRFADPMVIRHAQSVFGQSVRYIKLIDARPVVCGVRYTDGKVSRVALLCGAPNDPNRTQASVEMPIADLWSRKAEKSSGGDDDKINRDNPEYKVFEHLFREQLAGLRALASATGAVHRFQTYLEATLADDYASIASNRRANRPFPVDHPKTWADVVSTLEELIQKQDFWKNALFLWKYNVYVSSDPRMMRKKEWDDTQRRRANKLIVLLGRWMRLHARWLLEMPLEALEAHHLNTHKRDVVVTDAYDEEDDDEDELIEKKYGRLDDEEAAIDVDVDVLFGARGVGKSGELKKEGVFEALTLYEVLEHKRRFPTEAVALTLSASTFAGAKELFDKQEFVSGHRFHGTFSIKRDAKKESSKTTVGTYTTTISSV